MAFTATASTVMNVPRADVWKALTDPAMVKKYFFGVDLLTDWQVGSSIRYQGEWEGKKFEDKGTVLKYEENHLLETDYWSPSLGEDKPENYQIVRYELEDEDGGTRITITQEGAPSQKSADHSAQNWQMVLDGMKQLLES